MIKNFKEFLNEKIYRQKTIEGTWRSYIHFDEVTKRIIADFIHEDEHYDQPKSYKIAESIYDLLSGWYDENHSDDSYALDDEIVKVSTKFLCHESPGDYDTAPDYTYETYGEFEYDDTDEVEKYYNNIVEFFDTDPEFSKMKDYFTYEKFDDTIKDIAQEEFDENEGEFDEY